ncbi:MAG TPA: response regulator transcription factor [Thermoanaerobaculia bacterium]|nr:response regulator transcription factor [Thermoanaerobaculia bacterium]
MTRPATTRRSSVCLLAFHPLVLSEFERLLSDHPLAVTGRRLEPDLIADPGKLAVPKASVYVLESHSHRPTTEALVVGVMGRQPGGRVIVVSERFDQAAAFPLLRLGAKGLLTFAEANEQLARAVLEVAGGGFWVPRSLLSRFVDETITSTRRPRGPAGPARLSRREKEVMDALLENLSNKEIASKLNMSERTAKFHVSNLLAKYGVRRRADLILLTFTQLERTS